MSIEKSLQELTQAVNLLTKAVDLNAAVVSELNSSYLASLQSAVGQVVGGIVTDKDTKAELDAQALKKAEKEKATEEHKKALAEKSKGDEQQSLTDDEIKALPLYTKIVSRMMSFQQATAARNGNDTDAARADTLKILKSYSEDGKVISFVRAVLENDNPEVAEELITTLEVKTRELIASADESQAGSDSDFGDDDTSAKEPTADDVKEALRQYAGIEGRPAAIALLKKLTEGKSQVKDIDPADYAKVIKGLTV